MDLTPTPVHGDPSRLPRSFRGDLAALFSQVQTWRAQGTSGADAYKEVARRLGFTPERQMPSLGKKRLDLYKEYRLEEITYRVAIEVESSTIENGYNDLLKIMQLLKADEVDYGIVIFIQNNRATPPKLTLESLRSNLVEGLDRVLDDFRGKLFLFQFDQPAKPPTSAVSDGSYKPLMKLP